MDIDLRLGKPKTQFDENQLDTPYKYDALGRLISIQRPGDQPSLPSVSFSYNDRYSLNRPAYRDIQNLIDTSLGTKSEQREFFDGSGSIPSKE